MEFHWLYLMGYRKGENKEMRLGGCGVGVNLGQLEGEMLAAYDHVLLFTIQNSKIKIKT